MQTRNLFLAVRRFASFIFALVAAHFIALAGHWVADRIFPFISGIVWADILYRVIFYFMQVTLAILALKVFTKNRLGLAGFHTRDKAVSLRLAALFLGAWAAFVILFYVVFLAVSPAFRLYVAQTFPAESLVRHLVGGGLLAGIGEEPLFRALVVHILVIGSGIDVSAMEQKTKWGVSVLTGVIFMSAHIGYTFVPAFSIVFIDPLNLASTLLLGTVWAMMYLKTKSLLGPILAHTGANIIQYTIGHLAAALF